MFLKILLQAKMLLKERLQHRYFFVNFANFFKNTYSEEHLGTLLTEAATRSVLKGKVFLEISRNSPENPCTRVRSATLFKKRLWYRCFPVNFAKFLRTSFLKNTSGRLLRYSSNFSVVQNNFLFLCRCFSNA